MQHPFWSIADVVNHTVSFLEPYESKIVSILNRTLNQQTQIAKDDPSIADLIKTRKSSTHRSKTFRPGWCRSCRFFLSKVNEWSSASRHEDDPTLCRECYGNRQRLKKRKLEEEEENEDDERPLKRQRVS